jgi:signal transduction histidine kinase
VTGQSKTSIRVGPAAWAALEKARRLAAGREYAEASALYEAAREKGAVYEALAGQALCLYKMGRLAEALERAALATRARPESGEPHFISGLALKDSGRYEQAVEAFGRAEALGYSAAVTTYHRAAARFLAGQLDEAEALFEKAAALSPQSAAVFYNLAVTRIRRSRWREAAEALSRCAEMDPAGMARYHELIFEIGRAAASEEFHFRAHRMKNMLALLSDMGRRTLDESGSAPAADLLTAMTEKLGKVFAEMSDLLSWVRREPLELDVWDIHDVIESALVSVGGALARVKVEKAFDSQVPGIICDAQALSEAFLNIVLNAVEAMPGGGTLTIRTSRGDRDRVMVEFEDTGGGIRANPPEKIFQFAFTTKPGGNGLGLCQAARTIDEHGGSIRAENGSLGARFVVSLPFAAKIGESVRDMGLRPDLSEDVSRLAALEDPAEQDHS